MNPQLKDNGNNVDLQAFSLALVPWSLFCRWTHCQSYYSGYSTSTKCQGTEPRSPDSAANMGACEGDANCCYNVQIDSVGPERFLRFPWSTYEA